MGIPGTRRRCGWDFWQFPVLCRPHDAVGPEGAKEEAGAGLLHCYACWCRCLGTALTGITASALIRPVLSCVISLPCMGLAALFLAITLSRYADGMVYGAMIFFFLCAGLVDYKQSVYREYEWTHTARRRKRFWIPMWGT